MSTHNGKSNLSSQNFTTNFSHVVKFLPSADLIIALDQSGSVVEQGTFERLNANQGYVQSLSINNTSTTNDNGNDSKSELTKAPVPKTLEVEPAAAMPSMSD
jgi:ATP-binding cassette subfamily C (CFTR/MRP) protein 1